MEGPANAETPESPRITQDCAPPRKRWTRQRIGVAAIGLVIIAYSVGVDGASLLPLLAVIIVLALIAMLVSFIVVRWENDPRDAYWRGFVSFHEDDFAGDSLFPDIVRTRRPSLGRQGLSGGKLEIGFDGIAWRAGSVATPRCEISGSFSVPWERIEAVDVSRIPMKANFLGGSVIFSFTDGHDLVSSSGPARAYSKHSTAHLSPRGRDAVAQWEAQWEKRRTPQHRSPRMPELRPGSGGASAVVVVVAQPVTAAMTSISTAPPRGSAATPIAERV